MSEQDTLKSGTVIEDRYNLISEGKAQDLGMTYVAYDLQEDLLVDLRVVDARWGGGQEALDRLRWAEESLAALRAPGLIPYEQTGMVGEQLYLVHPHSTGETLAELLARDVRLDAETAVELTIRLCEVLAPVHRGGLTHGSLSPHCVLVKQATEVESLAAAEVVVLDAGLFPALRPPDASTEKPWGRMPYISPEQASGLGVQPFSDVYVIGALLYEMLIGRPPFRAADEAVVVRQHLHQEPPSLQIMDTSIPRPLAQIVYSALAKEPSSRYRNAGQLAHILRSQVGHQPQVERPPQPMQPIRQEQLVVPPPPRPVVGDTWSSIGFYDLEGGEGWEQKPEREKFDWVMIALLIAALLAVLGLIPLWRAVYSRYVTGPASSYLAPHRLEADLTPGLPGDDLQGYKHGRGPQTAPKAGTELDGWGFVWYNIMPSEPSPAQLHPTDMDVRLLMECRENAVSSGVQLTGQERKV